MNDGNQTKRSVGRGHDSPSSLQQRAERRKNRGTGASADWASASAEQLLQLVAAATLDGTLISFGYTRDGSAYVVGFFKDGDRVNEYCRPTEDVDLFLRSLAEDYSA